jgi:hypothetical protein
MNGEWVKASVFFLTMGAIEVGPEAEIRRLSAFLPARQTVETVEDDSPKPFTPRKWMLIRGCYRTALKCVLLRG